MRIPGPFSDDTWDWLQQSKTAAETARPAKNGVTRVVWELGLVLMIPLVGAGVVELVLKALAIY